MDLVFISLNEPTKELSLTGEVLIDDFLKVISNNSKPDEKGNINVDLPLYYTSDIEKGIDNLIGKYKKIIPAIYRIKNDFFNQLEKNEPFFILSQEEFNQNIELEIREYLISLKEGKPLDLIKNDFNKYMGNIYEKYQIYSYKGNKKTHIGESDKSKRICRYCGGKITDGHTEFKKIGHTISESLGNKNIITNDECDRCNWDFGRRIEQELINFFAPLNTIFSIRGKNGVPQTKGVNFEMQRDGNKFSIKYFLSEGEKEPDADLSHFDFHNKLTCKVRFQNCYKALVKYAVGIIPLDSLRNMTDTIKWLKKEDLEDINLPQIAIRQHIDSFVEKPVISVYIRKDDDASLPFAVGEFRYTIFRFVFIIPFTDNKDVDFTDSDKYNHFWSTFKNYSSLESWRFVNWSSPVPNSINYHFHFDSKEDVE